MVHIIRVIAFSLVVLLLGFIIGVGYFVWDSGEFILDDLPITSCFSTGDIMCASQSVNAQTVDVKLESQFNFRIRSVSDITVNDKVNSNCNPAQLSRKDILVNQLQYSSINNFVDAGEKMRVTILCQNELGSDELVELELAVIYELRAYQPLVSQIIISGKSFK